MSSFNFSDAIQNLQSAVKQQLFCLLLPITKNPKHLINICRGAIHRVTNGEGVEKKKRVLLLRSSFSKFPAA